MAVTGPRVGSSAKAETGKSSMKAARLKLRLTVPFRMSQMISRSVGSVGLYITTGLRYFKESDWDGEYDVSEGGFSQNEMGTIENNGNTDFSVINQIVARTDIWGSYFCLYIRNGPNRTMIVRLDGGSPMQLSRHPTGDNNEFSIYYRVGPRTNEREWELLRSNNKKVLVTIE